MQLVVGVDEAGRGPLAGPVAVGVAAVPGNFLWDKKLPGVTDSKQLSKAKREEVFRAARRLKAAGQLDFAVSMVSAKVIDQIGIVPAINLAMKRALKLVLNRQQKIKQQHYSTIDRTIVFGAFDEHDFVIKLDGGLKAPAEFYNQETIIKGDQKEKVIGLASICAKVTRDRYMVRKSSEKIFAPYTFADHKGYGTKKHRQIIAKNGLSSLHRQSYCKNIEIL